MPDPRDTIQFQHLGIGAALNHFRLRVPPNQREYAWEETHVRDLFQDFAHAIDNNRATYFLGTIVLTQGADQVPEVSDGQQRLATTSILISGIRDYFVKHNEAQRSRGLEQKYLFEIDEETDDTVPKLTLNVDDHEYFQKRIVSEPTSADRKVKPTRRSHERIEAAADLAQKHIESIVSPYKKADRVQRLVNWVKFIREGAQVIVLTVPDHLNAFLMFETLNDRGLKASQADLLKNHLLSKAGGRMKEVQQRWSKMLGTLESATEDDLTMTYLRHFLITLYGPTKEREVFERIKSDFSTETKVVNFATQLSESAGDYVALLNPAHAKWNKYGPKTKQHVKTMLDLGVEQIRPLMFAVVRCFSVPEAQRAFRQFVSWSVRFLIVGGRGGLLDRNYALAAHQVAKKEITAAKALLKKLADVVPADGSFEAAFSEARVSQNKLARYYLRALELQEAGQANPELVPNEDEESVNLEHVLPESPEGNWPNVSDEEAEAFWRRIGNLALMQSTANSLIGNSSFKEKKPVLAKSSFSLTKEIATKAQWDPKSIAERQGRLAKLAVKTWPLDA